MGQKEDREDFVIDDLCRFLSLLEQAPVHVIVRPDREQGGGCDAVVDRAGGKQAVEHTRLDEFQGQRADDAVFNEVVVPLETGGEITKAFPNSYVMISVRRPTAGDVEDGAGAKRTFLGAQPRHESRDLLRLADTPYRDPRDHILHMLGRNLLQDVSIDYRWRHCVDKDAVTRDFLGQCLRQANDSSLCRRVRDSVWIAFFAGNRGYVHDTPVLPVPQVRDYRAETVAAVGEIHSQHVVPVFIRQLRDGDRWTVNTRIVDENVEATKTVDGRSGGACDRSDVGDMHLFGKCAVAQPFGLGSCLVDIGVG